MNLVNNALSGTLAAQAALSAASQNIANMATPGYTRQGAMLATAASTQSASVSAGNGVKVLALTRFSDAYTDPVRVIRVRERWTQRTRQGKEWKRLEKEQTWIWVVAGELDAFLGLDDQLAA